MLAIYKHKSNYKNNSKKQKKVNKIEKKLQFTAKTWKQGNSYVVTVPKQYLTHKLLKEGQKYIFTIKEEITKK